MVGRKEIAQLAGVSKTTVTRVLSGEGAVSKETQEKINRIIKETGYTHNVIARNMAKRRQSNMLALLVPDITNSYYTEIFSAMSNAGREYGLIISVYNINQTNVDEVIGEVIANRAMGIVNMGLVPITHESLRRVESANIKFVYTGIRNKEPFGVKMNYYTAMKDVILRLKENGCRSIGFMFGMKEKLLHDNKVKAFKEILLSCDCKYSDKSILLGKYPSKSAVLTGYLKAKELYADGIPYDALFCLNDMMAIGAMRGVRECGHRVPEDVSIVGFDNIVMGNYCEPPIATIGYNIQEEAKAYVDYCTGNLSAESVEVVCRFIPRASIRGVQ